MTVRGGASRWRSRSSPLGDHARGSRARRRQPQDRVPCAQRRARASPPNRPPGDRGRRLTGLPAQRVGRACCAVRPVHAHYRPGHRRPRQPVLRQPGQGGRGRRPRARLPARHRQFATRTRRPSGTCCSSCARAASTACWWWRRQRPRLPRCRDRSRDARGGRRPARPRRCHVDAVVQANAEGAATAVAQLSATGTAASRSSATPCRTRRASGSAGTARHST